MSNQFMRSDNATSVLTAYANKINSKLTQVTTMPTAAAGLVGKTVQFVGETTSSYTNGHIYQCQEDPDFAAVYSWVEIDVQDNAFYIELTWSEGQYVTTTTPAEIYAAYTAKRSIILKAFNNIAHLGYYNDYGGSGPNKSWEFYYVDGYNNTTATPSIRMITFSLYTSNGNTWGSITYKIHNIYDYTLSTMPTAAAIYVGKVYQYIGSTNANYTQGYFYTCVNNSGTYSWQQIDVQPAGATAEIKNYCPLSKADKVIVNNVVFTVNRKTGVVTANGTALGTTGYITLTVEDGSLGHVIDDMKLYLEPGEYKLTGCPEGGSTSTYFIALSNGGSNVYDTGSGVTFTVTSANPWVVVQPAIGQNYAATNIEFRPMIKKADEYAIDPSYVLYKPETDELYRQNINDEQDAYKANAYEGVKNLLVYDPTWYEEGKVIPLVTGVTLTLTQGKLILTNTTDEAITFGSQKYAFIAMSNQGFHLEPGKGYILTGCDSTAPNTVILAFRYNDGSNHTIATDRGHGASFYLSSDAAAAINGYHIMFSISSGTVIPANASYEIKPMIRHIEDTDETFAPHVSTNKELEKKIQDVYDYIETEIIDLLNHEF